LPKHLALPRHLPVHNSPGRLAAKLLVLQIKQRLRGGQGR
jgi:hypothetical protein